MTQNSILCYNLQNHNNDVTEEYRQDGQGECDMNRAVRLVLALLVCALALANGLAGAEEMPTPEATAEFGGFSEQDAPYEGIWVPFEDGFRLYVPSDWHPFEITEAQAEAGLFYRAGNDGGDGSVGETAMGVAVSYFSAGQLKTVGDLARDLEDAGFEGVEVLELNGLSAAGFRRPGDGYRGVAFFHPILPEYILQVCVTPIGDAGTPVEAVGSAILRSLSPTK